MQNMLTLTVVICAHNEQDWIGKTLVSLLEQRRLPDEIIVVDNASTDSTPQVVERFIAQHPNRNIRLVHEAQKGLFHARDTGWRAATSEIIVTTDADITFPADWLVMVERLMSDPNTAAVTGTLRYHDALPVANWVTAMGDSKRAKAEHTHLNGGNSALRRRILAEVDGYAGKPPDTFEDQYLTKKLNDAGYFVRFAPEMLAWHTFRRFNKEGLRGYLKYIFFYTAENIYPDHLSDETPYTAAVVIPAHNAARTIEACLASLLAQSPRPQEIIVVDVASTDGTAARVEALIAVTPSIRLLPDSQPDLEHAWESGWRAASSDLIVRVDANETFPEGWLAKIHAAFIVAPGTGAVGGEIRGGAIQWARNAARRWRSRRAIDLLCGLTAYRREALLKLDGRASNADALTGAGYTLRFKPEIYAVRLT